MVGSKIAVVLVYVNDLLITGNNDELLISNSSLGGAKPAWTPLESNQKLTSAEYDDHVGHKGDATLDDIGSYQRLIGKLLYLTMTSPDISFVVQTLNQFLQHPKRSHMEATMRIVKYIKKEPGLGVLLSSKPAKEIKAYCDANWASCPNTRRSVTRYLVKYGNT
ncbi:PREDICTED: uncharacterized protein LOC109216188 [Nicotiana attenuata]|uniref:uncharacterized protein LOC109216188 n=1 Tax=Nicotiana attenuata TaxID=49451 RepID=UPI00090547F6|nr:PREDICTED: uncharacterized protein LOC109216188 [Nicotiana attenuata]